MKVSRRVYGNVDVDVVFLGQEMDLEEARSALVLLSVQVS